MTSGKMTARLLIFVTLFAALVAGAVTPASAVTIDWVTVSDVGNAADTTGYGAVADAFRIMKFEWTNAQYTQFLNAIDPDGSNPNSVYNASMGISLTSGAASGFKYAAKANMGNKPVVYVSWFDAARVANWLQNGAQSYGTTNATANAPQNTGAYTLATATSGTAPSLNDGASFFIPKENQWYKAAYYKGSGTNAGYWAYATQSSTLPATVTADATGTGSAGSSGNSANYNSTAGWGTPTQYVTTVGTNGGPGAYQTFDMTGNVWEWNDLAGVAGTTRGRRGGSWNNQSGNISTADRGPFATTTENFNFGFRLAAVPVPEPTSWVMGLMGITWGCWGIRWHHRTRRHRR